MLYKERIKRAGKVIFIGFLPFIVVYYALGLSPAVLSGIGAVHTYFVTSKGFYRRRVVMRTIKIIGGINLAVLFALLTKGGFFPLLAITFLLVGVVTFFSFEEYLGGFMAHRPILLIYLLSLSNDGLASSLNSMAGVSIGIILSVLITQILWPANPDKRMTDLIELYLDRILEEIMSYRNKKNTSEARKETRASYQRFLGEFYKSSHGTLLSTSHGRNLFDFALALHNYIECIRREFTRDTITSEKISSSETFIVTLKNLKGTNEEQPKVGNTLEEILVGKKKDLMAPKDSESSPYQPSHKNYFLWLRRALNPRSVRFRYAIKMAIILTLGVFLAREHTLEKSIWLPTTMLVLTLPYTRDTKRKTLERITGTLLGILLASIIIPQVESNTLKAVLAILSFFPAFFFLGVNYPVMVMFTTLSTVLMTISYLSPETVYLQRGFYTILAGVIVIAAEYLFLDREHTGIKVRLISMFQNDLLILRRIAGLHREEKTDHIDDLLLKGYLYRELLMRRIKEIDNTQYQRIIRSSGIFMDKLMFLYSEFKNQNLTELHLKDIRIIEEFLKAYISFIEREEEGKLSLIQNKIFENLEGKEKSTVEISELLNHFIEGVKK